MKVLIVEDESRKSQRISLFIQQILDAEIFYASSVQEGISEIKKHEPSLILLDMSLPIFTYSITELGFHHNSYGGEDILEYIDSHELDTKVIVITAFDRFGNSENALTLQDLDQKFRNSFSQFYIGSILFRTNEEESWQVDLKNKIELIKY